MGVLSARKCDHEGFLSGSRTYPLMSEHGLEERRLVKRLLDGDEEAFDIFIAEYYPRLYRFAWRRLDGDAETAQDVVQATFGKVIPSLRSFRGEAALFSWMCSICRFETAAEWRRKGNVDRSVHLEDDSLEVRAALESLAMGNSPEDELQRKELGMLVRTALDHLPPDYGRALEWKYLNGAPVKEIAARLGVSGKAAESLLTRARSAFREAFGELSGKWIST